MNFVTITVKRNGNFVVVIMTIIKMKTLLFPTNFSDSATHAIKYGYSIASQIEANIVLCNAVLSPEESPQVGLLVWPVEETDTLLKDSTNKLKQLVSTIHHTASRRGFKPTITIINEPGTVDNIIHNTVKNEPIDLVVIGTHVGGVLNTLLLGNQARTLIDETTAPLLLVPPLARIGPIKKIAFATDFKNIKADMKSINTLISLAKPLKVEIILTHIYDGETQNPQFKQTLQKILNELSAKSNYPHIYFKEFVSPSTGSGLEWLCQNGDVDILAMVHRSHTFIDSLFRGSQTQKMAGHTPIPLLVFPATPKPSL